MTTYMTVYVSNGKGAGLRFQAATECMLLVGKELNSYKVLLVLFSFYFLRMWLGVMLIVTMEIPRPSAKSHGCTSCCYVIPQQIIYETIKKTGSLLLKLHVNGFC